VLRGLTYKPSGAVVAARTSLPEEMGGALNFDYRFAWLRDLSLTIRSLWIAACPDEAGELFHWTPRPPASCTTSRSRSGTAWPASAT
jgi:GH15 family glucan-1,4-alpha-glucosidase